MKKNEGYDLNSDAYKLFMQIEVGIREFLIKVIAENNIFDWTSTFLGRIQFDSLKDIGKRIYEAEKANLTPDIADLYLTRINRAMNNYVHRSSNLCHPFYFLNWADMENLINKNPNSELIDKKIGKDSRNSVVNNLRILNLTRNDVAHSRFINYDQYLFLFSAFNHIAELIPDFKNYYGQQTTEEQLGTVLTNLKTNLIKLESSTMLDISILGDIENSFDKARMSFWFNSFYLECIPLLQELLNEVKMYKEYRRSPGGLLLVVHWKKQNAALINNLKILFDERKV